MWDCDQVLDMSQLICTQVRPVLLLRSGFIKTLKTKMKILQVYKHDKWSDLDQSKETNPTLALKEASETHPYEHVPPLTAAFLFSYMVEIVTKPTQELRDNIWQVQDDDQKLQTNILHLRIRRKRCDCLVKLHRQKRRVHVFKSE